MTWRDLFEENLDALFQSALLLVADPEEAEANVLRAVDKLDFSRPPDEGELLKIQSEVVLVSLPPREISPAVLARARSLLRPELWPVLELQQAPRVCFVLRLLLGYATASCAQTLGIEESGVRTLLQIAIFHFQHSLSADRSDRRDGRTGVLLEKARIAHSVQHELHCDGGE